MNADQRKQTSAMLRTAADQARELFRLAVRPGVTPEARDKLHDAHDRVLTHLERLADLLDSLGDSQPDGDGRGGSNPWERRTVDHPAPVASFSASFT